MRTPAESPLDYGAAYHEGAGHALAIARLGVWKTAGWRVLLPGAQDWSEVHAQERGIAGTVLPPGRSFTDPNPPRRTGRFLSRGDAELDRALRLMAAREGIMCLAGVCAQFPRVRGWSPLHEMAGAGDLTNALLEFNQFGFDPPNVWHTLLAAAIEVVDRDWGAGESIAHALAARRALNADEVFEIIEAAPHYRNPYRAQAPAWLTHDPVKIVAQQLECWRRHDWVEHDEREQRAAAISEVQS